MEPVLFSKGKGHEGPHTYYPICLSLISEQKPVGDTTAALWNPLIVDTLKSIYQSMLIQPLSKGLHTKAIAPVFGGSTVL